MDTLCHLAGLNDEKYRVAVDAAVELCKTLSPNERFAFVEASDYNFLLVTNSLPCNRSIIELSVDEPLSTPLEEAENCESLLQYTHSEGSGVNVISKEFLTCGAYHIYTPAEIGLSVSSDKTTVIEQVLREINTPGLLDHDDVTRVDVLLWLLFYGPLSRCSRKSCLGRESPKIRDTLPALLPPILCDVRENLKAFIHIAQAYVYTWYKNYKFKDQELDNTEFCQVDVNVLINELSVKYENKPIPVCDSGSRICFFCSVYLQNRVGLDAEKKGLRNIPVTPLVIDDPIFKEKLSTKNPFLAVGHIVPDSDSVRAYPIYDLTDLFKHVIPVKEGVYCFSTHGQTVYQNKNNDGHPEVIFKCPARTLGSGTPSRECSGI